jgi:hypothetical protein
MKLFRTPFILLSVGFVLKVLPAQASPIEQTLEKAEFTKVLSPESNPESTSIEAGLQSISQQAADLAPIESEPVQSSMGEIDEGADRSSTQSNLLTENNVLAVSPSDGSKLTSLQSQSSIQTQGSPEPTPHLIPVEFVLPSSTEYFRIVPDLFPPSNQLLEEDPKPEEIQFSTEASEQILKANAQYKRIPQVVDKNQLLPFFTVFPLNGTLISHLTEGQVSAGYEFGNGLNDNFLINGLYAIKSQVKQSISQDNVFVSDQTGLYLQLQTVPENRTITLTRIDPQTVNGLQFQLSFTGSCSAAGRFNLPDPNTQCSLTPAIISDRSSIDPRTLQTTRIFQLGSFGDIVSPESLAILAQPGFQGVGGNGQAIGLDLLFPNTGSFDGNSQSNQSSITRFEDLNNTYTLGLYRLRQVYKSNAEKSVLGRTIHGFTGILFDQNFPINLAVQGAAQVLPDFVPDLKGNPDVPAVTRLNQSLIFSANNNRLPERSFVIYQVGYGESNHPQKNQKEEPGATFNSLWIGLSPVTERSFSTSSRFVVTSPSRITEAVGAEGGSGNTVTPLSVLSLVNLGNTVNSILSSDLSSFYTQGYFTFFGTDVNRITKSQLIERNTYYPHISLTGNITESNSVLRYYGGVITAPEPKAYLGVDYTNDLLKDLRLSTSMIGYLNPDRDYYSKAESRLEKTFRFSRSSSLSLSGNFRYVFDQVADSGGGFFSNPVDNFVSVGATGRIGIVSAGVTQFLDILPSSVPTGTGFNLSIDLVEHGSLSGYFVPQRGVTNYGVLALLKLNPNPNAPTLSLSWNRAIFDFGSDAFNNALNATEDKFQILFRFGAPANPFMPNVQPVASNMGRSSL